MSIDDMTLGELKDIQRLMGGSGGEVACPFEVGKSYLICGVTRYFVGTVTKIVGNFLVLKDASWVPDTGRYSDALEKFTLNEIERVPDGQIVHMGAMSDASVWDGPLPTETK